MPFFSRFKCWLNKSCKSVFIRACKNSLISILSDLLVKSTGTRLHQKKPTVFFFKWKTKSVSHKHTQCENTNIIFVSLYAENIFKKYWYVYVYTVWQVIRGWKQIMDTSKFKELKKTRPEHKQFEHTILRNTFKDYWTFNNGITRF